MKSFFNDVIIPEISVFKFVTENFPRVKTRIALLDVISRNKVTYDDLHKYTSSVAAELQRKGARKCDVFAIYSTNTIEFVVVMLAAQALGMTVAYCSPLGTAGDLEQQLKETKAKFIYACTSLKDKVIQAVHNCTTIQVKSIAIVPTVAVFLAKSPAVDNYDLTHLEEIVCSSAPLSVDLEKQLIQRFNLRRIIQGWGMTELTVSATAFPFATSRSGSVGTLIPNTEAKVLHEDTGEELQPGQSGEIVIRGPQVMKGYLNNPEATRNTIRNGWLHSGDIGYFDKDGYLFIVDRLKELIKYKGLQVAPSELEALLLAHSEVADVAVIGVPDLEAGELPKAIVVLKDRATTSSDSLVKYVNERVAPHKRLRGDVEFVKEIPKSAAGKILRRVLRDRLKSRL